jgi:hypothetical protein
MHSLGLGDQQSALPPCLSKVIRIVGLDQGIPRKFNRKPGVFAILGVTEAAPAASQDLEARTLPPHPQASHLAAGIPLKPLHSVPYRGILRLHNECITVGCKSSA